MILNIIFGLIALVSIYMGFVRPLLVRSKTVGPILADVRAAGGGFFTQAWVFFKGLRTKLFAALLMVPSFILTMYDQVSKALGQTGIDWKTLIPPNYTWAIPVALLGIGFIINLLRNNTNSPPAA